MTFTYLSPQQAPMLSAICVVTVLVVAAFAEHQYHDNTAQFLCISQENGLFKHFPGRDACPDGYDTYDLLQGVRGATGERGSEKGTN